MNNHLSDLKTIKNVFLGSVIVTVHKVVKNDTVRSECSYCTVLLHVVLFRKAMQMNSI